MEDLPDRSEARMLTDRLSAGVLRGPRHKRPGVLFEADGLLQMVIEGTVFVSRARRWCLGHRRR